MKLAGKFKVEANHHCALYAWFEIAFISKSTIVEFIKFIKLKV